MTFKQKVQSMQPSQIIQAMVDGLRYPHVTVEMGTYGAYHHFRCIGCAATNAICEIYGKKIHYKYIEGAHARSIFLKTDLVFLKCFEKAINELRKGHIVGANHYLEKIKAAQIKFNPSSVEALPRLSNNYTDEQLQEYEKLAEYNRKLEQASSETNKRESYTCTMQE